MILLEPVKMRGEILSCLQPNENRYHPTAWGARRFHILRAVSGSFERSFKKYAACTSCQGSGACWMYRGFYLIEEGGIHLC